jgi:hypothetical protein
MNSVIERIEQLLNDDSFEQRYVIHLRAEAIHWIETDRCGLVFYDELSYSAKQQLTASQHEFVVKGMQQTLRFAFHSSDMQWDKRWYRSIDTVDHEHFWLLIRDRMPGETS